MWILLGYLLITTALVPVIGRLADMVGPQEAVQRRLRRLHPRLAAGRPRQPRFHGIDVLICRMIQGVGGALLLTNSTAIVTDAFRRGRVGFGLGVNQIAAAAGFVLGPVVGGLLTAISWRWVFLINVPLGIIGVLWGIRAPARAGPLPASPALRLARQHHASCSASARLLAALSMVAFPAWGWTAIYVLFVVGDRSGWSASSYVELRAPQPMLDLRLFYGPPLRASPT